MPPENPTPPSSSSTTAASHAVPLDALIAQLATNAETGLSTAEAAKRLEQHGANELAAAPPVSAWQIFISQFQSLVVWILLVAAVISGLTADWLDAAAIVAVVLLNAMLGFFQEGRAEQAIAGLRKLIVPTAKVDRDGQLVSLAARELVPGDIIQLEAGDHVPADARLIQSSSLRLQEAVLTGESVPVEKDARATLSPDTPLAERTNFIFMSCTVAAGSGRAAVVNTGMRTEIGHIAGLLEAHERKPTPLQRELESVGRTLAMLCLAIVAVVFLLSLWRGDNLWNGLMTAISLAVAAVPEGLPAVVTVTLALGLQRMVRRNALIRKLHSVETLGSVTVICSDKTGTLTRNEMTVREIVIPEGRYHVTGAGYEPTGDFLRVDSSDSVKSSKVERKELPDSLLKTLRIGAVCNNARLAPPADSEDWQIVGDPMEGALIVVAQKADALPEPTNWKVQEELPFDSERKMMSVLVRGPEQEFQQFTKGAPESILAHCHTEFIDGEARPLSDERRRELLGCTEEMAGRALRVLACAFRGASHRGDLEESQLTLAGLVGIIDPPREEVRDAIALCREAGIRTVMITGDHPTTAVAIGKELGLLSSPEAVRTGAQLDGIADAELPALVTQTDIYARVTPAHKLRIVSALQNQGNVVAMTGDGVNDAPAVKTADIGVAMGRTGTDVTREAAAMVLLDDNFTSIVSAVEEGRAIYDNIRKILVYLLSCNLGEMLLMLIAAIIGWPSPLVPIQLLWINLVTDGFPAFALAMEEAEPELMHKRPRKSGQHMLSWGLGKAVLVQGIFLAAIGLAAFWFGMRNTGNAEHARSLVFNAIVLSELFRVLAARSSRSTFWQLGVVTNPYVFAAVLISILLHFSLMNWPATHAVFEVTHHTLNEWLFVVCAALVPVTLLESYKLVKQWRKSSRSSTEASS